MKSCQHLIVCVAVVCGLGAAAQGQTVLQFNGTNQYVTMGTASGLGATAFTIECWFKRTGAGAATSTGTLGFQTANSVVPMVTKGRGEADGDNRDANYFLGIHATAGVLVADFEQIEGAGIPPAGPLGENHPVCGSTVIAANGVWHHAAATYSAADGWKLYLDGVAETVGTSCSQCSNTPATGNLPNCTVTPGVNPRNDSIQHFGIATAMTSTGGTEGFFAGSIDEVRVWNVVRSAAQIAAGMNQELTSGTGLIGRWGFNEGTGTTTADSTTPAENGTLTNGPTWVAGGPALFNEVTYTFQQGVSGYSGAVDTFIDAGAATADNGPATALVVDLLPNQKQALIRFGNLFASDGGPIPNGATISSATLRLVVGTGAGTAQQIGFHRMKGAWTALANWNTFGATPWNTTPGIQLDNVEANTTPDTSTTIPDGVNTITVTSSLQAWLASPASNFGWVLNQTADDSVTFSSSDNATTADRPRLTVATLVPKNASPNQPTLVAPANGAPGQSTSPTLTVNVTDPESNPMTVTFFGRENTVPPPGPNFTIIALPDTQFYSCDNGPGCPAVSPSGPAIFNGQTQWIVDNKASRNIAYVAQLGDCVEHGNDGNGSNPNPDYEWIIADAALSLLENPLTTLLPYGIPYGIAAGNHDQSPLGSARGTDEGSTTTRYTSHFGLARFSGRSYYGGRYDFGAPATYPNNNDNHYDLFSVSGLDFIAIALEWDASANATRTAVISWANGLLQTYSNRRAIVYTHYMVDGGNPAPFSNQGQAIYDGLKANPNLFLMLGGHQPSPAEGQRFDTYLGNRVDSLLSDYQGRSNGGDGWLRIMTFSPANNNIHVQTYSPTRNGGAGEFETDADSDFVLPYTMSGSPPPFVQIGSPVTGVASGSNASIVWPGLNANTTYEWKTTVSDGTSTTNGPTWSFGTTCTDNASCNDGNPCTDDVCDDGSCTHTNNTSSCNDGLACTTGDTCSGGACAGTPVSCPGGSTCNPANGRCEFPPVTVTYQNGDGNGYTGTVDTYLHAGTATTNHGGDADVQVDVPGTVPADAKHGLLRFDNIFGSGPNQIPPGATISSANLTVNVTNLSVDTRSLHRMLQSWTDADTWDTRVGGIQADDVEARSTADSTSTFASTGATSFSVTADVAAWQAGATRNGWAIFCANTDGWAFTSAQGATQSQRPMLSVTYVPHPPCNTNADCNDNNACTDNVCSAGICTFPAISCNDSNACTTDTCSPASGCVYTPINCNDNDGCTDDGCNPATGCTHTPVDCDDQDPCTTDSCQPANTAAVSMNGSGQYVNLGTGAAVTNFGTGSFTFEGWFRAAATSASNMSLFRMGRSGTNPVATIQIVANTTNIQASVEANTAPTGSQSDTAAIAFTLNAWTHFAVVVDRTTVGNQRLKLYVNGALASDVGPATWGTSAISSTDATVLGANRADTGVLTATYNGAIDEVRIWNTARTLSEIQANMNVQLVSATGLTARWGLNEGIGTTAADSVGANSGTLTGGATWVTGVGNLVNMGSGGCVHLPIANCCTSDAQCNDSNACTTDTCNSGTCVNTLITCNDNDACTNDTCNPASGCVYTPLDCNDGDSCTVDTCVGGSCQHVVDCDDGNPCTVDSCAPGNTFALALNGTNQYVAMGQAPGLGTAAFTLECWLKRSSAVSAGVGTLTGSNGFAGTAAIPLVTKGRGEEDATNKDCNYFFGIHSTSNVLIADFEEGASATSPGLNHPVCASTAITDTNWHHAAASYSVATGWAIYLDGVAQTLSTACSNCTAGTNCALPPGVPPRSDSVQHFAVGSALNSTGVADGYFAGAIDEVRVWNVVRTASEIASGRNQQLTSGTGLIGRWGMNDGSGSTATSSTGPNGTLTNGPTWTSSGIPNLGGGCVHAPVADGTGCSDGNVCNGAETCQVGTCTPGTSLDCNDNNPCTDDSCDSQAGCQHVNNSDSCNDGNACTTVDTCSGGSCIGTPMVCDDGNLCTTDACVNGTCEFTNNNVTCNDNDPCTINDTCSGGACAGTPIVCDDGNPCTTDTCVGGLCQFVNNSEFCDDGDPCTLNDTCVAGGCAGASIVCNDNNPCTDDACVGGNCVYTPNSATCNDGNACTENDACSGSVCSGTPIQDCCTSSAQCDDSNPCTDDACVNNECQNTPNTVICNDGNACTENDVCANGACAGTAIAGCCNLDSECTDSNPCTDDACVNHACEYVNNSAACNDGNACTENDLCSSGSCAGTPIPECCNDNAECADGNPCTVDTCVNHECQYASNSVPCDDGDACTLNDTCNGGTCTGTPLICNDNNPCTDDACVGGECVYTPNSAACSDGNACTTGDVCINGTCTGTPLVCNDSNPCTDDACVGGECVYTPNSATCSDGNACTTGDLCINGTCTGTPMVCNDNNPCTDDSCVAGNCVHTPNAATCDDGNACTHNDLCSGGACSGTTVDCDDSDACTIDGCDNGVCSHNPANCDDGNPCTNDFCVVGTCQHTPIASCNQLSLNVLGSTQICAGDAMDVALNVAGLQAPINGVQVLFQYEPARLALTSISVGDGLTSPWNSAMPSYFSDTGGSVVYSLVLIGAGTSADARVATLHFTALNPGSNSSPTTVAFRPDQGEYQTKLTTSANVVILPSKENASPVTVGPQIQVSLQVEGLTHAVTRDVTFVLTDCQHLAPPQVVTRPVAFNASGTGSILLTGVGAGAEWISVFEGHTLSHKLPLSFTGTCYASVGFTGADQLVAGDLHTAGVPQDNLVDIVDFAILVSRFGTAVADCGVGPAPQNCSLGADITGDGVQDTADFNAIQINFFRSGDDTDGCPPFIQGPIGSKPQWDIEPLRQEAKSVVRVSDLSRAVPSIGRADLNADGKIDTADIRAFAAQNRLPLMPAFEKKLTQLEVVSAGR